MTTRFDINVVPANHGMAPVTPQALWKRMSGSPEFYAFEQIVEARLENARMTYEVSPASEFNRGAVNEIKNLLTFLRTGDYA